MKIFIVEDSEDMRENLTDLLSGMQSVEVIGHAEDESDAIKYIDGLLPDVVTLDLNLRSGSGMAVLKYIKKHHALIKVIVLTNCTDRFYADSCKSDGAEFFFDKILQFSRVQPVIRAWANEGCTPKNIATLEMLRS